MSQAPALRVALLNPCYWPEVRRGAERFAHDLAVGLRARGLRPRLIVSHPGRPRSDVEDGVEVRRVWRPPPGWLRRRRNEDHLTHVPFSYLALERGKDDIAQALYPTDAVAAAAWARRTGRPWVFSYLGIADRGYLTRRRWRLELTLRALRDATALTVLSHAAAEAMWRTLGVRARVIHPGVDTHAFSPGPSRAPEPTILCASAIEQPMKRVELLLEAFDRVRRARPGARLLLARPREAGAAAQVAGRPGVELVDLDRHEQLLDAYRRAWVTALPSRGEAFGLVLVESLACGTPVVGSRWHAIPEVVDSPAIGRLFSPDDAGGLEAALLEALELRGDSGTTAACRNRALGFSLERTAAAYEQLYRELLDGRRDA